MPITMFNESLIGQISNNAWGEDELDLSRKIDLFEKSNHLTLENIRSLVEALNKNTRIKKLILRDQELDDECAIELAKINSPSLVALDLMNNFITVRGTQALANNQNFTWLSLSSNDLGDVEIAPFAYNKKLTYLDLSLNEITDEGGKLLIEADTALEGIDLSSGIDKKIGQETIKALAKNTKIKTLNLWRQNLDDESIQYLLKKNKHLRDLNLGANNLTDAITPSLLNHPGLITVNLSYNDGITNITADQIYKHIEEIPLVRLYVDCTDISTDWEDFLRELLADREKAFSARKASERKKRTLSEDGSSDKVSQGSSQSLTLDGSDNEEFRLSQRSSSHESADRTPESKKARLSDTEHTSTSFSETSSTSNSPSLNSLSTTPSSTALSESDNSPSLAVQSVQSKVAFFSLDTHGTATSAEKNASQADADQYKVNEEARKLIK